MTRAPRLSLSVFSVLSFAFASCAISEPAPAPAGRGSGARIQLSKTEASQIGRKIWQNECGGTVEGLTSWNKGEYFASLGIGHFIWYVKGNDGPFEESFPPLLRFMGDKGVKVPGWLAETPDCPWRTREEFVAAKNSPKMRELRGFLQATIPVQTEFILYRLQRALPTMLASVPAGERTLVEQRFYAVGQTPTGVYALMDYINFKGEGTKASERYKGQGWGMLQVLQEMRGKPTGAAASREFAAAADRVLTRRVANAPKNESQWLPGWKNRARTYVP